MIEAFFSKQKEWCSVAKRKEALLSIAKRSGFTDETFQSCLTNQQSLDNIRKSVERGSQEVGVTAAPTFFINAKRYTGALSAEEMADIIDVIAGN